MTFSKNLGSLWQHMIKSWYFWENTAVIRASLQFVQGPFHWTVVALYAVLVLKFLIIILCVSEYICLMKFSPFITYAIFTHAQELHSFSWRSLYLTILVICNRSRRLCTCPTLPSDHSQRYTHVSASRWRPTKRNHKQQP